jgi:hypothetical protein
MKKLLAPTAGLGLFSLLIFQFCVKPPDYPKEPVIAFKGLSKNTLRQGTPDRDSLTIYFSYTDGDGDLGFPEQDATPSIFVKDSRDSFLKFQYQLPYVEPQGAGNGISGEVAIVVPTSCCTYVTPEGLKLACNNVPVAFDTLYYLLSIQDRAGNRSNEIQAGPIRLICQ